MGTRRWSLRDLLLSEAVAWAVQNSIGIFVATLFLTVAGLRFLLACCVSIFACVALLLLSPDRSAGGRIFAAAAFVGNICCGMVLGGALVSLAYLARGSGEEPFISMLPKSLQSFGSFPQQQITEVQDALASAAASNVIGRLPPELQDALNQLFDWGVKELRSLLPAYDGGFWALLIILPTIVLIPLSIGRARAKGSGVLITMMPVLLMGVVMSFGWMTQILTLRLYWRELVLGFIYAILASALCSLAGGCLVYVRSTHDEVRASGAALLREAGARISQLSSRLLDTSQPPAAKAAAQASGTSTAPPASIDASGEANGDTNAAQPTDAFGERDVQELEARLKWVLEPGSPEAAAAQAAAEARPLHAFSEVQQEAARFDRSLGLAAVEPPWPGLCSQPGADLADYEVLKREFDLLSGAIFALKAACGAGRLADLELGAGVEEDQLAEQLAELRGALAHGLGLAAAACAGAAEALDCMPALGPCYGPKLAWRPIGPATWTAQRAELGRITSQLVDTYRSKLRADGLDFGLSVDSRKGRALLFTIPTVVQLMWHAQDVEAAVAAALWVPTAPSPAAEAPGVAAAAGSNGSTPKEAATVDVEFGKPDLEAAGEAAAGAAAERASLSSAAGQKAVSAPQPKRSRLRPYLKNAVTLLALSSSLAAWATFAKGVAEAVSGMPAALSSWASFKQAMRRPHNQFAFKFWFGLALAWMAVVIFTWKAPKNFDIFNEANLFFNWQPMYFWMAACIVIQPSVEGSVNRAMARVVGVFLGAMLGLAAGANGRLLENPYYFTGMVVMLVFFFSLPAPIAEFRYSLCMISYTAVAVLSCTYVGCCDASTTWLSMAGKAVPTALGGVWGLLVTMLLPNFASNEILAEQASILRDSFACMKGMFAEHRSAALERRPPNLSPLLAQLEACAERITAVGARIGANTIDPKSMPLTALLLHLPPAVNLMQPALRALTGSMLAAIFSSARVDTGSALVAPYSGCTADGGAAAAQGGEGSEAGEANGSQHSSKHSGKAKSKKPSKEAALQATPYAAASDYFRVFAEDQEITAAFEAVLETHGALVEACAEDMDRGRSAADMEELRAHVGKAAAAAATARLDLQRCYSRLRPVLLQRALQLECGVGDMLALAFVHGFMMATDQVLGVVQVLQAATAQRRDNLRSWLQAWAAARGQRPARGLAATAAAEQRQSGGGGGGSSAAAPTPKQQHAALQADFFDREVKVLQDSITPEVEAKLARIAAAIPGLSAASRVLDAGAGEGALIPHLQARGVHDILAVDVSPGMLAALQQRVGAPSSLGNDACVRTWLGDVTELPSYQGPFDVAVFNAVFGNLLDQHDALVRTCFLLKPGSYLVISHPLGRPWHEGFRAEQPQLVPNELPQREALEALIRDLPLHLESLTDEDEFYMALLQVPEGYAHPAAPIWLTGSVTSGFGRGSKQLGVPTANLPPEPLAEQLAGLPDGVYFGWAQLDVDDSWPEADRQVHKMVMNIGKAPTFGDAEPKLSVEAHIMHRYSQDFYGQPLRLVALGYIRPEVRFGGLQELLGRINTDIGIARSQLDLPQWQDYAQQLAAAAPGRPAGRAGGAAPKPRHFLRPSLLATGLTEPEHVLQHCLALYRKADLAALRQYLPDSYAAALAPPEMPAAAAAGREGGNGMAGPAAAAAGGPSGSRSSSSSAPPASSPVSSPASGSSRAAQAPALPVGPWFRLRESGPLAPLAGVLDVGARRVLPGHLLRRSQVLSTLRPSPDAFQQRVALTACTGETSVFDWRLRWQPDEEGEQQQQQQQQLGSTDGQQQPAAAAEVQQQQDGAASSSNGSSGNPSGSNGSTSSDSGSRGGRWVLDSVERDASSDTPLPTTPHPKAAPEAIAKAQLAALQQGDLFNASCFSSWRGGMKGHVASRRTGLGFHLEALRSKVQQEPYSLLLHHAAAQLGTAVLPSQREMLQEVAVLAEDGASARFLWRLGIGAQGCWMVTGIFSEHDLLNTDWQQQQHI
ncbi:riboflavin kinase isoform B [Chlorella sorokiniana]|uniref:riboflavin kinase n=1 Tax=Chlorella sorokiniana TaxID=3076 RepID=A0A2P6U220_CHLSO|nr:riboflavin kinase isoform B [Chlorella sorokiniana]|eukprot:PRW60354.1 riboflavin kinase isoform B [Chlorella sorokiniana]